ncbi:hexokinase-domain-containing protein [Spinellus fusiger]|nr:hexokinase-domain-containing protein [Spinellus fusiger]
MVFGLEKFYSRLSFNSNNSNAQKDAFEQILQDFDISTKDLQEIITKFGADMNKGLASSEETLAMIGSYVAGAPTGEETGRYLALDLGGTNLRVCGFTLLGHGEYTVHQQKYVVSDELKKGDIRYLCDFIADCVDNFITENGSESVGSDLQLGFTFSFPVLQTAINRGTVLRWTKGFNCSGAIGKDIVVLLQDAFLRKNVCVQIAALVNDTVGTLMAHAYKYPETSMGVILGTGTNAAYLEKLTNITKWERESTSTEMVVNMEWGAFDNERKVLPLTVHDNKLDRESINPHKQTYEKLISGMYLGEIARNAILYLVDRMLLFKGFSSDEMNKQWGLDTAYISAISGDHTSDLTETKHILESVMQIPQTTLTDRQMVKEISIAVGRRAARLSVCGMSAVIAQQGRMGMDSLVAIDGSVYEFFPKFEEYMTEALVELYGDNGRRIKFALARDGSGLGAAIIAMMSHKTSKANAGINSTQKDTSD